MVPLSHVPSPQISSTRIPRQRTLIEAMLLSCDQAESGDIEGAILTLQAANDAHEVHPTASIPPEH